MRLRTLIGLTVSAIAAFCFIIAWMTGSMLTGQLMVTMLSQEHSRQASALGLVAAATMASRDDRALAEYLRTLPSVTPKIDYAFVEGEGGRILFHSDPHFVGRDAESWKAASGSLAEYTSPVTLGGRIVAIAHVGVPSDLRRSLLAEMRNELLPMTTAVGALGIVLSLVLGFGLSFALSRPVSRLAEAAEEVSRGNLAVQVPVASSDELGQLTRRFNGMVERLGELDRMKDAFITSVSHDLRTPLAAIKMSLDFMLHDDPEGGKILPKHRRTLTNLSENATRLNVFVSNILDAAKMKAGRMEYHPRPVALAPIVSGLEELYGVVARNRGIALVVSVPADFPPVSADPERLERVLTNLLSNAVKFTASGGKITLGARLDGPMCEIHVQDTGQGIAAESLPELFRPFHQADVAAQKTKLLQGSGLGLFIVKQTVEAMGGSVDVRSEPGRGTRVALRLPAAPGGETARAPREEARSLSAAAERPKRVLVVDDERSFGEMIQQLLESRGYHATILSQGKEAARTAAKTRPDVILMDLNLEDMRGVDAVKELKGSAETADVPIIVCSASLDAGEIRDADAAGAIECLAKPLNASELDAAIRRALAPKETA